MVRETRHLWVGNLPENIREDRIREHFKRYGRVQSVKLLPRIKDDDGSSGLCATVAFMDIKSASKAHNMEHKLDERCLSTEYYEPAAIPGASAAPLYVSPRFPHGPADEHATFDRTSHFYERREGDAYLRRAASAYHVAADPLRGRARDRLYRNGPYSQLIDRAQPAHHRPLSSSWSYEGSPSVRYAAVPPTPEPYPEERREAQPVPHKKRTKSRSGSESGSNSGSSRSRSRSRSHSHSSSSSSQSASSSASSGTSTPATEKSCSPHSHHSTVRSGRVGGVALQSTVSAPHTNNVNPAVHSEDRRPLAICVRNLPVRSSDTSLKDGLFHEYKKHGKVTWVKVVGQAGDRYALVCFKKPDDVEKALEVSHDKLFFGCKIEVAPYQGYDVEDNEFRPYEAELDEYNTKATRTLFIGNLEKDVTASELRKNFEQFGEIIEIDIKKQGVLSSYAFCQYADILSVVKAIRTMDGEHLGNNRIKLGFGKSLSTNCVWVDGIADSVSEKYLNLQFHSFGDISQVTIDRERGRALIYFEEISCAQEAVREMRGVPMRGRKLQVDFASRECQEAFYEHLEKQGHAVVGGERPWDRYDNTSREVQASRFETTVVVPGNRFMRYDATQRQRSSSYSRTTNSTTGSPAVAAVNNSSVPSRVAVRSQRTGQRYEYYDSEYPERRYRNYDEFSQGSAASHDDSYEQELRDYGYCQRDRGDSSPSPVNCDSEGMSRRSVAVVPSLQSVVVGGGGSGSGNDGPGPHPPDIRHLQKERVHIQHLLQQLECTSSGDEDGVPAVPKKRVKLEDGDECADEVRQVGVGSDQCYEGGLNHSDPNPPSLLVTTHNHRKSVSEVRRLSDVSSKHCSSRRQSTDSSKRDTSADRVVCVQAYSPHPVCKRRKTGSSASESEERASCRSGKHSHHHHHHHDSTVVSTVSGGESVDGSRPGTPLCDERPENLLPPSEPRRIPRDRLSTDGPLSLPLPRFATQVMSASPRLSVSISGVSSKTITTSSSILSSPPSVATSPRPIPQPPPSPVTAPPPASPPRPPSLPSTTSSDSELSPPSPTLEERIRSLDEKYEKWSGSRALSAAGGDALAKLDAAASEKFRFRHKLLDLDLTDLQPSEIVKSVLAKRSVFDEDSKRLENVGDKYEPREFVPYASRFQGLRVKTEVSSTATKPLASPSVAGTPLTPVVSAKLGTSFPSPASQLPQRILGALSPLHSPSHQLPKSPFSSGTPTTPVIPPKPTHPSVSPACAASLLPQCGKLQNIPKTVGAVSPRPAGATLPPAKGLQYPFPSHPPVLPTTTVATTTAAVVSTLVSVSSAGLKQSLPATSPTTSTGSVFGAEVNRTCIVKPVTSVHSLDTLRLPVSRSATVTVPTTATCTKPSPEVASSRVPIPSSMVLSCVSNPSPSMTKFVTCSKPGSATATVIVASSDPRLYRQSQHAPDMLSGRSVPVGPVSTQQMNKVSCAASLYTQAAQKLPSVQVVQTVQRVPGTGVGVKCTSPAPVHGITSPTGVNFAPKSTELSPKILKEVSTGLSRTDSAQTCLNIPTPTNNPTLVSTSSPRVSGTVVTCTGILSTVTTVAAACTVTTTVLTNTLAATSMVFVTTTTCETSVSTACTNFDSLRHCAKSKTSSPTKKDVPINCLARDKQQSEVPACKPCPPFRKDSTSSVGSSSSSSSKKERDSNCREQDCGRSSNKLKGSDDKKPGAISGRRDSEKDKKERELADYAERDKKREDGEKERRRESVDGDREKKKEKDSAEVLDRRKDLVENAEKENADRDRWKERDDSLDKEKCRENHPSENTLKDIEERERRKEKDFCDSPDKRKDKQKHRANIPASIGCKRRMSSQDSIDSVPEDAKRLKLSPASATQEHRKVPERRDSKDSGRSSSSSSKKSNGDRSKVQCDKPPNKQLEEKIRDDKHILGREQHREKSKDKSKKKSKSDRDSPKDQREPISKNNRDIQNDKDFSPKLSLNKRKDDSETEEKDDGKHKHGKKESKEKKRLSKDGFGSCEFLDEKCKNPKKEREKRDKKKDDASAGSDNKLPCHKKDTKKTGHTDTDSEDGSGELSGPKKHSIFDIVDDGPAYISMYDKVKARSTKNMQKLEEEKRQEKMRENFNLLKQSRAKREEKKRSTSWDEDSDTDAERERDKASKSKRHNKVVISSSSEDGEREERKTVQACSRPVVRIKKEESCTSVKSDSDSDLVAVRRSLTADDDESMGRGKNLPPSKKGSRSKLISDTSEDDISTNRLKLNAQKISDIYSAESEVESGFPDFDDKQHARKIVTKNNKLNKNSELSLGETPKKSASDSSKILADKSNFKKMNAKNKLAVLKSNVDSSDDENVVKFLDSCKTEIFGDEKQQTMKKSHIKNKLNKCSLDLSDDESSRHLPDVNAKPHVRSEEKHISLTQAIARTKNKNSVESSDEDDEVINSGFFDDDKTSEFKKFGKSRLTKVFSDFPSQDLKKNIPEVDKCDIFGENIQTEKILGSQNNLPLFTNSLQSNLNSTTMPLLEKKMMYFENNALDKNCDVRKKQHKKKQKRQKNFQVDKEALVKSDVLCKSGEDGSIVNLEEESKLKAERKRHKRERRKSSHSDDRDGKPSKVRKKRPPKPELGVLKIESNLKREEKIEDIFGPLSDDSDPGIVKQSPIPHDNGGRSLDKLPGKWQVSLVYGSDSDSAMAPQVECFAPRTVEKDRKKKDKKRRDKKARESEMVNVDLVEAGRVLEAKLLGHDDYPRLSPITPLVSVRSEEANPEQESDVFRFTDEDDSVETLVVEKTKEKKKKRKKSKEEKQNRREHHHHHHHEKNKSSPDRKLGVSSLEDSKPSHLPSPSLPSLDIVHSPPSKPMIEDITSPAALRETMISPPLKILPITLKNNEKKKPEKFIPGFGTEIDDIIHETAVKSISEFDTPKPEPMKEDLSKSESLTKGDDLTGEEEKPRAIISQEETEDAVAALLGESFGPDFNDCYVADTHESPHHGNAANAGHLPTDEEEETRQAVEGLIDMKPDTPQSEPDLQIDTDTDHEAEDGYTGLRFGADDSSPRTSDGFDFSRPPKTPDFHPSYYGQQSQNLVKPYETDAVLNKPPSQLEKVHQTSPLPLVHSTSPLSLPQISPPPQITVDSDETESCPEEKTKGTSVITSVNSSTVEILPEPAPIPSSVNSVQLTGKHDSNCTKSAGKESDSSVAIDIVEPVSLPSLKPDDQVQTLKTEPESKADIKHEPEPVCEPQPASSPATKSTQQWPQSPPLPAEYLPPPSSPAPLSPATDSPSPAVLPPLPLEQPVTQDEIVNPKLCEQNDETEKESRTAPLLKIDNDQPVEECNPVVDAVRETTASKNSEEIGESSFEESDVKTEDELEPDQVAISSFGPSDVGKVTDNPAVTTEGEVPKLKDTKEVLSEETVSALLESENSVGNKETLEKELLPIHKIKLEPETDYEPTEIRSENEKDVDIKPCVGIVKDIDGSSFKSNEFGLSSEDGRGYSCSSKEDSGFMSTIKEEQNSDIARESDFSEPESDLKPDNDFVASILASESMNHALNTDDSRSEVDSAGDTPDDTYKEREIETVSVIKETEAHLMSLREERDPFAASPDRETESPAMKDSLDALIVNKENDAGLLVNNLNISNAIRVDSNFWTSKEVNLDSVIKKVDALCSSEDLGGHEMIKETKELTHKTWYSKIEEKDKLIPEAPILREKTDVFDSLKNSIVEIVKFEQDSPKQHKERIDKEIKLEAPSPEVPEERIETEIKLETPSPEMVEDKMQDDPVATAVVQDMTVEEENKLEDTITSQPEKCQVSLPTDVPEQLVPCTEPAHEEIDDATPLQERSVVIRNSRRGRRGGGGRRKAPTRSVTTRRTRTTSPRKQATDSPMSPRRGGRGTRGGVSKLAVHDQILSNKKPAADVYEFHDDSEDEGAAENGGEKSRPRLILTIKSPVSSNACGGKEGNSKTPPVVETREEFPVVVSNTSTVVTTSTTIVSTTPAVNTSVSAVATSAITSLTSTTTTRKSRRLLERDGSRTTVDDVIEDVIRSAAIVTRSAAAAAAATSLLPRRSSRQTAGQRQAAFMVEPRKTTRGGKRQQAQHRRASETHYESGEDERKKPEDESGRGRSALSTDDEDRDSLDLLDSNKMVEKGKEDLFLESEIPKPLCEAPKSSEPTTLIDPVTGLLMQMRESEEGQYIPVTTAAIETQSLAAAAAVEPCKVPDGKQKVELPPPTAVVVKPVPAAANEPPLQWVPPAAPVVVTTSMHKLPLAVVCTTPSMVQARTVTICVSSAKPAVPTAPGPRPLKAHVLQPIKPQPPPVKLVPGSVATATTTTTVITTTMTTTATTTTTTAAATPKPAPAPQVGKVVATTAPMTPKAMILQAVATGGKPPIPPGPAPPPPPAGKPQSLHVAAPQSMPVNMKTLPASSAPVNPKAHLLAAANVKGLALKPGHHMAVPLPSPPGPLGLVSKVDPPKAHLGLGQQPMLTGAVASPPLKAPHMPSPQPIVAGASSTRLKSQVPGVPVKNMMDPPKVEVSMGGCIVVPTVSPQARGQVLQAGLPVSAFEASLGEIVHQHVAFPHHMRGTPGSHDLTHHYVNHQQLYHQYLRVQQEAMGAHIPYHLPPGAVRSPLVPTMDIKSEPESEGSSPPLELRRPASNGAGVARVAHSLQSPHDRTTDSPQVATVYVHHAGARLPHFTRPYYEEPPPAHLRTPRSLPLPGVDAPVSQPRLQVATPPHASQVPPQADSLLMLLQRYPVMWQGLLALKNDQAAVQMHFVFGNPDVARESLPCNADGTTPPLRIAQRMRLEQTQVEGVAKKMQIDNEHCMLLALPCGRDHMDVLQQSNNLQMGFITYLQQKQAAGIVNIAAPGSQQAAYVVHIFPSCDFANDNLARIAPDLLHRVHDLAHLLIIIATV